MIKYKLALILWRHDSNGNGEDPIYLRLRVNGVLKYISTGHYVMAKYWDVKNQAVKDSHLKASIINSEIHDLKTKIQNTLVKYKLNGETISAAQIKDQFSKGIDLHNIFDFIDQYIIDMKGKREESTLDNYRKYSRKLLIYHGNRALSFEQMTKEWLQGYENWLRAEDDEGKSLDGNYVFANFKMLKTFFNAAKKKQIITVYPFAQYESPEYKQKEKDYLTLKELDRLEELADKLTDRVDKQTAVYFLHGCYCGLRLSDWYQFRHEKHVVGKNIRIMAKKNGEQVSMPVTSRLKRNLDRIKKLPLDIEEQVINRTLKELANTLKIKKHLTSHCARKTFAVTMCADQGIGVEVCASLMGITVAVCVQNYYRVSGAKINAECLRAWESI